MAVSGLLAWATCPRHKISPYFVVERKTRPDNPDLHSPPILELGLPSPGLSLQPRGSLQNLCSAHTAAAEHMEKPRPGGGGCHTRSPSKSPQLPPLESLRAKESLLDHPLGSLLPNFILPELRPNFRLTVILCVGAGGNAGPEDNWGAIPPPSWGREKVQR